MKATINTTPTGYDPKTAARIAADLAAGDPDWSYIVEQHPESRFAYIRIEDESGEFVAYHVGHA